MENPIDLDKLDRAITDKKTNVTALSERIGHDRVVVSGWKNGRRIPTLMSALKLAKGLGVSVEELCYEVWLPGELEALGAAEAEEIDAADGEIEAEAA